MTQTILIVDDDPLVRDMLALGLEDEGYAPVLAANGRDALDMLQTRRPLVVISDLMMPVMDGWQLFHTLHTHPEYSTIPIIVMSALYNETYIRQHIEPAAVLKKPLNLARIVEMVDDISNGTIGIDTHDTKRTARG